MTVRNPLSSITYTGNGAAMEFAFDFLIPDAGTLSVYLTEIATGERTVLEPTQYSVTGFGREGGGSVTYPSFGVPLPASHTITIERSVPYTQELDISNQGGFHPEVLEQQLDRIVMQTQQNRREIDKKVASTGGGGTGDAQSLSGFPISTPERRWGVVPVTHVGGTTTVGQVLAMYSGVGGPLLGNLRATSESDLDYNGKKVWHEGNFVPGTTGGTSGGGVLNWGFNTLGEAAAFTVPATIVRFFTKGYYAQGDGGGATYARVATEPIHAGKVRTLDGAWWELQGNLVNVKQFGARGDGQTDDAAAINAAFAYLRAHHSPHVPSYSNWPAMSKALEFPTAVYAIRSSINGTGLTARNVYINGNGAIILGRTNGTPIIDAIHTRYWVFENIYLIGDEAEPPSYGFVHGRTVPREPGGPAPVADTMVLRDVKIIGRFTKAGLLNIQAERSNYDQCTITNDDDDPEAVPVILDAENFVDYKSQFTEVITGPSSMSSIAFYFGFIQSFGFGAGPAVKILAGHDGASIRQILFYGCGFNSPGDTTRELADATTRGPIFYVTGETENFKILGRGERTGYLSHMVLFENANSNPRHQGFELHEHYVAYADGMVDGTTANAIFLIGAKMSGFITQIEPGGFFGPKAQIIYNGEIMTSDDPFLNDFSNCYQYNGVIYSRAPAQNVKPPQIGAFHVYSGGNVTDHHGVLRINNGYLNIGGHKVLGEQQPFISDLAGDASLATNNAITSDIVLALRAHGIVKPTQ